jgi:hypothetical protein
MQNFICKGCGQVHEGLALAFGAPAPAYYYQVPEKERGARCQLSSDQCIIDSKHFFIVGNLLLPIHGSAEPFCFITWVSLSAKNFKRAAERWYSEGRESEPPYFCWVSSALPGYPNTLVLKAQCCTQPVGFRPLIELEPTDHPLSLEQRHGISQVRLQELVSLCLHGEPPPRHGAA